jgi:hypothetical protein
MFDKSSHQSTACSRVRSVRVLILSLSAMAMPIVAAAASNPEAVEQQIQALAEQLAQVKNELAELKAQQQGAAAAQPTAGTSSAPSASVASMPTFFGYGELGYSRPSGAAAQASADMGRFVLGIGYQFDERTHFAGELELEHAVSSATDQGEVEVEQAYIDHELRQGIYAKAGLMLIPSGLLNENHEPSRYYGVFRNHVETAIIPTTWREGAMALQGNTAGGLRWDVGVSTGFDLSKWDATSTDGQKSPLGSIHQELSLAKARDLSAFGALNYTGVPGLRLGASLFTGGASQGQPGFGHARVTLWESHARWQPGNFDLAALYARGHISDTQSVNTALVGNPTLIPESFFGWYVQGAYQLFRERSYPLAPFLRYERFNTAASYAALAAGLTPLVAPDQQAWTSGFNLGIARGVVVKADYLWFRHGVGSNDTDRLNLGLGYQF